MVDHAEPHEAPSKVLSLFLSTSVMLVCSTFTGRFPVGCMAPRYQWDLVGLWPCDPFVLLDIFRLSPQPHSFAFALKEMEEIGLGGSLRQRLPARDFPPSSFEAVASVHSITVI